MTEQSPLLTIPEAAALIGVAVPTVHRWIDRGYAEPIDLVPGATGRNRALRISLADAEHLRDNRPAPRKLAKRHHQTPSEDTGPGEKVS